MAKHHQDRPYVVEVRWPNSNFVSWRGWEKWNRYARLDDGLKALKTLRAKNAKRPLCNEPFNLTVEFRLRHEGENCEH
jgi:hypothetical protein